MPPVRCSVVGKLELIFSLSDLTTEVLCQQQFEINLVVYT